MMRWGCKKRVTKFFVNRIKGNCIRKEKHRRQKEDKHEIEILRHPISVLYHFNNRLFYINICGPLHFLLFGISHVLSPALPKENKGKNEKEKAICCPLLTSYRVAIPRRNTLSRRSLTADGNEITAASYGSAESDT